MIDDSVQDQNPGMGNGRMAVELAELWRGGYRESVHSGNVAVVDAKGRLLAAAGDPHMFTFPRSALKPIQTLAVLESGAAAAFAFTDADIALCTASHSAESHHIKGVSAMLAKAGLEPTLLRCGAHAPYHLPSAIQLYEQRAQPQAVHNNCSGKHTGMLAAAKHLQAPLDSYLDIGHPVQQLILDALCEVAEVERKDVAVTVDGCSAPAFGIPLTALALVFARLANPDLAPARHRQALRRVRDAMLAHPEMVAGTDSLCTDLMVAGGGRIVAKAGAEGVYGVGSLDSSFGVAVKVLDGNKRAAEPAVVAVLDQLDALDENARGALASYAHPVVKNAAGIDVGEIKSTVRIRKEA